MSGYRILDAIIFLLVSLFDWLNQARDRVFYQISKHFEESVQNAPLLAAHFLRRAEYLVKKWEKMLH